MFLTPMFLELHDRRGLQRQTVDSPTPVETPTGAVCTDIGKRRMKKPKNSKKMTCLDST
jgi:hypothetical protein